MAKSVAFSSSNSDEVLDCTRFHIKDSMKNQILKALEYRRYVKQEFVRPGTIAEWKDDPVWPTEASKIMSLEKLRNQLPMLDVYVANISGTERDQLEQKWTRAVESTTTVYDPSEDRVPEGMDYWTWFNQKSVKKQGASVLGHAQDEEMQPVEEKSSSFPRKKAVKTK